MKRNSKIVLLFTLASIASSALAQNKIPLTFNEAYQQMNQNSHVLKQAGYEVREKEADKKSMFGLRTPKVFVTATAIKMAALMSLSFSPFPLMIPSFPRV